MNVLLVGGGGRECAIAQKIHNDPILERLFVDSWNPGFPGSSEYLENIYNVYLDLIVIGPETPLSEGLTNRFMLLDIPVFGPTQQAAALETSKIFAKHVMKEVGIPTADYEVFEGSARFKNAEEYVSGACVVKVDGLAAGKGVYVCDNREEAVAAIKDISAGRFGKASLKILIEEKFSGPEISVFAICDGKNSIMLPTCRDYKRRYDGDEGPNTGGMGVICPVPDYGEEFLKQIQETIVTPLLSKMRELGREFRGVLYIGLMLTEEGHKVLEFNVRFGDPECQALMSVLDDRLLPIMYDAAVGNLSKTTISTVDESVCCVVLCDKEYPYKKSKGKEINIKLGSYESIYLSGTDINESLELVTNGGRIMTVYSLGRNILEAREKVYSKINSIRFENMDYRKDIGGTNVTV